jgi:hypothetical protein
MPVYVIQKGPMDEFPLGFTTLPESDIHPPDGNFWHRKYFLTSLVKMALM